MKSIPSELVKIQLRVFVNNGFAKFARKSGLTDEDLCSAVKSLQAGIVDAELGGGLYKWRAKAQESPAAFVPFLYSSSVATVCSYLGSQKKIVQT